MKLMMKYRLQYSSVYKKQYKKMAKRGLDMKKLDDMEEMLKNGIELPSKYRDHALKGDWKGYRECHIAPDWLLIYRKDDDVLVLVMQRTGTHSDLF